MVVDRVIYDLEICILYLWGIMVFGRFRCGYLFCKCFGVVFYYYFEVWYVGGVFI